MPFCLSRRRRRRRRGYYGSYGRRRVQVEGFTVQHAETLEAKARCDLGFRGLRPCRFSGPFLCSNAASPCGLSSLASVLVECGEVRHSQHELCFDWLFAFSGSFSLRFLRGLMLHQASSLTSTPAVAKHLSLNTSVNPRIPRLVLREQCGPLRCKDGVMQPAPWIRSERQRKTVAMRFVTERMAERTGRGNAAKG